MKPVLLGLLVVCGLLAYFSRSAVPVSEVPVQRSALALRRGEHRGIDVSAHQGDIDWPTVRAAGVEFAYIKAEGGDWVDDHFAKNWEGAGAAGVRRGAYHFFTLKRPGRDQAANFLKVAPPVTGDLPPMVDLEFGGNTPFRPTREVFVKGLGAFLERVEKAHGKPVIFYLNSRFQLEYKVRQAFDREIWIGKLHARPSKDTWRVWQHEDNGTLPGIAVGVDLDVMKW